MFLAAILLAAVGSIGLAVGTHLQYKAVHSGTARNQNRVNTGVVRALTNPLWLLGMGIIAFETVLNVVALGLAPVAVVQPVGSLALVVAVIISAVALGVKVKRGLMLGISIAVGSVAVFVGISARFAVEVRPTAEAVSRLAWLLLCLILVGAFVACLSKGHLVRVVGAGILFGTVASATHVIAVEIFAVIRGHSMLEPTNMPSSGDGHGAADTVSAFALWILVGLIAAAAALGMWLVQTAYASGPPETVLAGLTVLDPLVAVLVGAFLLGEYSTIPPPLMSGLVLSGLAACIAIVIIVRNHPATIGRHTEQIICAAPTAFTLEPMGADGITIQNGRS